MLTKVYLEGPMAQFGAEWDLQVSSAREAIRLIDANRPGFIAWIRKNADIYAHYRIVVEYVSGKIESLSEETYMLEQKVKSIRFEPIIGGAGQGKTQIIVGAILVVVGAILFFTGNPGAGLALMKYGGMMMLGGVITSLVAPKRKGSGDDSHKTLDSDSFDGPTNTTAQGNPVPLIYGRCLVGSQVISANLQV